MNYDNKKPLFSKPSTLKLPSSDFLDVYEHFFIGTRANGIGIRLCYPASTGNSIFNIGKYIKGKFTSSLVSLRFSEVEFVLSEFAREHMDLATMDLKYTREDRTLLIKNDRGELLITQTRGEKGGNFAIPESSFEDFWNALSCFFHLASLRNVLMERSTALSNILPEMLASIIFNDCNDSPSDEDFGGAFAAVVERRLRTEKVFQRILSLVQPGANVELPEDLDRMIMKSIHV